jgi:hypothetical protein
MLEIEITSVVRLLHLHSDTLHSYHTENVETTNDLFAVSTLHIRLLESLMISAPPTRYCEYRLIRDQLSLGLASKQAGRLLSGLD